MASYIRQQPQGQAPIAPPAAAPPPTIGAAPAGSFLSGGQPNRPQDYGTNPVNDVANFGGANTLPGGGNVNATSKSSGNPFQPTFADPMAAAALMQGLSNYHYSIPGGGYLHNDYPSGPLGGGHNEYYIGENHMAPGVSDPNANKAVGDIYSKLGALPMVQGGSAASRLAGNGAAPAGAPSINDRLGDQGPWRGPWEFPGWHLG